MLLYYSGSVSCAGSVAWRLLLLSLAGLIVCPWQFRRKPTRILRHSFFPFRSNGRRGRLCLLIGRLYGSGAAVNKHLDLAESSCEPAGKPPDIILIHESRPFDVRRIPASKVADRL